MKRAIFLDRDGVLNDVVVRFGKPYPPPSLDRLSILPGVAEALLSFRGAGFHTIVVTNQPDAATDLRQREIVDAIHSRLASELALDAFYTCIHVDADGCECRKPAPGMLTAAARDWSISLEESYMVGDRWRDIGAGRAVGCTTFWIDRGYREQAPEHPDFVVSSLSEVDRVIRELEPEVFPSGRWSA